MPKTRKPKHKTQAGVRVDAKQMRYLKYAAALTDVPVAKLLRRIIGNWLDTYYAAYVGPIEKERKMSSTTAKAKALGQTLKVRL